MKKLYILFRIARRKFTRAILQGMANFYIDTLSTLDGKDPKFGKILDAAYRFNFMCIGHFNYYPK